MHPYHGQQQQQQPCDDSAAALLSLAFLNDAALIAVSRHHSDYCSGNNGAPHPTLQAIPATAASSYLVHLADSASSDPPLASTLCYAALAAQMGKALRQEVSLAPLSTSSSPMQLIIQTILWAGDGLQPAPALMVTHVGGEGGLLTVAEEGSGVQLHRIGGSSECRPSHTTGEGAYGPRGEQVLPIHSFLCVCVCVCGNSR